MARNSGGGFGTWFYGFLVGGVIGVGCCAAAALYITKAPIPFVNKVNQASEKINPIAGGTIPDPNKPLSASGGAPVNAPKSRVVTRMPYFRCPDRNMFMRCCWALSPLKKGWVGVR